MLYLLMPDLTLRWADLPATSTLEAAAKNDVDLAQLPWEPSERQPTQTVLRWALRHGVACSAGLVLHAPNLSVVDAPNELRAAHENVQQSRAKLAASESTRLLEQVIPGSAAHSRQLDAAVDRSVESSLAEADEELEEALSVTPDSGLVEHWEGLGGTLPSPL